MLRLHENIRALRKGMGYTQEQLADALGVTIGAVSKWEKGAACPELVKLTELAAFFEVSTDALLGVEAITRNSAKLRDRIFNLVAERNFEEALSEADMAIVKYPNDFDVVMAVAEAYKCYGMVEHENRKGRHSLNRAIELYERALDLNRNEYETQTSNNYIFREKSSCYAFLKQEEKCIEELIKHNVDKVNSTQIGMIMALRMEGKAKEAEKYLSEGLLLALGDMINCLAGYVYAGIELQDYKMVHSAYDIFAIVIGKFREDEKKPYYFDRTDGLFGVCQALAYLRENKQDDAKKMLMHSYHLAKRYDANPVYALEGIKLIHCDDVVNIADAIPGETAVEGLGNLISTFKCNAEDRNKLEALWEELIHEC